MTSTSTDRRLGVSSGMAVKVPCRVATTAAITLTGEQTIDGVAVVTGDRVLVKDQSTTTYNGIWVCDTGDWSRAVDADGLYDITDGTLVPVAHGTAGGQKVFQAAGTNPITPGTSAITFRYRPSLPRSPRLPPPCWMTQMRQRPAQHWGSERAIYCFPPAR